MLQNAWQYTRIYLLYGQFYYFNVVERPFWEFGKYNGKGNGNVLMNNSIREFKLHGLKADFQSSHEAPRSSLRVLASN
jgi:hypothetical protein